MPSPTQIATTAAIALLAVGIAMRVDFIRETVIGLKTDAAGGKLKAVYV